MNKKEIHQILAAQQKPTLTTLPFVLPRGVAGRRECGGGRGRERGATGEATGSGLSARARKKAQRKKRKRGNRDSAMRRRREGKKRENIVENS